VSAAYAAVSYKGYWYWIDDSEIASKSTFKFLMILFSLAKPVRPAPPSGYSPPRYSQAKEACWGSHRKHRISKTPDGEPGRQYLCPGYRELFRPIRKYLRAMATLMENDLPVAAVMQAIDRPLIITRTPAGPGKPS
jgi:hypothetical protein